MASSCSHESILDDWVFLSSRVVNSQIRGKSSIVLSWLTLAWGQELSTGGDSHHSLRCHFLAPSQVLIIAEYVCLMRGSQSCSGLTFAYFLPWLQHNLIKGFRVRRCLYMIVIVNSPKLKNIYTLLPATTFIISILGVTSSSSSSSPSICVVRELSVSPLRVCVRDVGTLEYHLDLPPGVTISIFESSALKMVPLWFEAAFRPVVLYRLMRKTMKPYSKNARLSETN